MIHEIHALDSPASGFVKKCKKCKTAEVQNFNIIHKPFQYSELNVSLFIERANRPAYLAKHNPYMYVHFICM